MRAVALFASTAAAVLVVHPLPTAFYGAHAALKAAAALLVIAVALVVTRSLRLVRAIAILGGLQVVAAVVAIAHHGSWIATCGALAAPALLVSAHGFADDDRLRARAGDALVVAAAIAASIAMFEIFVGDLPWAHVRRPQSTLVNRNFLAHLLAVTLPWMLLTRRGAWREGARMALLFVSSTVLVVTRCRAAFLALLLVGAISAVLALVRRASPERLGWSAVALAGGAVTAVLVPNRLAFVESVASASARLLDYENGSGAARITQMKVGLGLFRQHPFIGWGIGGWERGLAQNPDLRARIVGPAGASPNCDFVRAGVEGGIWMLLGMTIVLAFFFWAYATAERTRSDRAALASGCIVAVLALLDAPLFRPETSLLTGICAAALPARFARVRVPGAALVPLLAICLVACVALSIPH